MQLSKRSQTALLGVAVAAMFSIGAGAAACVTASSQHPTPHFPSGPDDSLVVGYAREHPDPVIKGSFADKLASGEIKIVIEIPKEHAMASFGKRDGVYTLTIDPGRLKPEPTLEEFQTVLSILSHEHAHYRQYVEGEMANYHPGGTMSDTQCTLVILVEIDAHGKACRDAKAYGWETSVAQGACERTNASIAAYFMRERLGKYPECRPVWEFFASHAPAKPRPTTKVRTRSTGTPKKSPAPIYMPPP